MGEFDLIARYFTRPARPGGAVALGVGDDCALLAPTPGMQLAISSDMLVEGRHFFADVAPEALGHKALAVNLSDLAACGARPLAFTLALSLPRVDEAWLEGFSRGMWALADAHGCELVGGDTTQGPLNICITVFGEVPPGQALLRSGARPGDDLYVSGTLGDARLALEALLGHAPLPAEVLARARQRLERPTPRVALGQALRGIASSAMDLSDGLLGDLSHILKTSGVGARIGAGMAMVPESRRDQGLILVRQQRFQEALGCFEEALVLGIMGFIPGLIVGTTILTLMGKITTLPLGMTPSMAMTVFLGTIVFSALSGAIATRRLDAADPADLF